MIESLTDKTVKMFVAFYSPKYCFCSFFSHHTLDIVYKLLVSYIAERICAMWNCYFVMDKMYTVQGCIQQGSGVPPPNLEFSMYMLKVVRKKTLNWIDLVRTPLNFQLPPPTRETILEQTQLSAVEKIKLKVYV